MSITTPLESRFELQPLKFLAPLRRDKIESVPPDSEYLGLEQLESWTGRLSDVPLVQMPEGAANVFNAGDILFGKLRPYLAKGWVADRAGYCSTESLVLSPSAADPRFLRYCLLCPEVISAIDGSTYGSKMPRADWSFIGSVKLPAPSRTAQERIANFLDEKTARIDALIAEKTVLLRKLVEWEKAQVAAHILGTGLPGKRTNTRISEIGTIPEHWILSPMMRLVNPRRPIMYGIVLPGPNVESGPSVPIVKGGDVRPERLKLELLNRTTPEIEAPYARARLAENDIVYSIRGSIGDAELVPKELTGANITQDVARIAPRDGIDHTWLLFAAKSQPVFCQLEQLSIGAAVRGINIFDLKRARVPTPPAEEQKAIAMRLIKTTAQLRDLHEHTRQHIHHLLEYRASLISAAVTGRLEISNFGNGS